MEEKKEQLALRLKTLEKALSSLEEALSQPYSVFIRDATIQRFEYTFELSWKLLRRVAKIEGREANSPRQAIRVTYETGIIKDIDLWFEMLEDRNKNITCL
ncbi:nucleotidyltransferase substrate binding protein [Metallumcola ferriviriculae]|uniref:Nucleotidyltransferase substrate binding protein n=1 Tax=Metallumcola ferriviriculae TaxID=3039180 RepID=A0AAU0UPK3_9FIRM|nr:nucleotidyltransferase substrate binding protein [Desulfitibacteraceae bacterium MK1]